MIPARWRCWSSGFRGNRFVLLVRRQTSLVRRRDADAEAPNDERTNRVMQLNGRGAQPLDPSGKRV